MKKLVTATILTLSTLASTSALAKAPVMASNIVSISEDPESCLDQAKQALREEGFTQRVQVKKQQQAVSGETDDATMWIRCLQKEKLAIIVVAGLESMSEPQLY
jgi:hypothetical protein